MFSNTDNARSVSYWTNLGVRLPKDLTEAIKIFESVSYVEVGHSPTVDIEKVTAANAEEIIRGLAQQLALATTPIGVPGPQGQGPLERAKAQVLDLAARCVINQARLAIPDVIEQLTPGFDDHAAAYASAINALPEAITADTLLTAGSAGFAAYEEARREAVWLNSISNWVASTAPLSVLLKGAEVVLRILRPETPLQLLRLEAAHYDAGRVDQAHRAIDPVLVAAVRQGVEFGINHPVESRRIRADLHAMERQLNKSTFR